MEDGVFIRGRVVEDGDWMVGFHVRVGDGQYVEVLLVDCTAYYLTRADGSPSVNATAT